MTFTVTDFQDLLALLDQRPDWRDELRRRVLGDQILELPALVRQLAETQARTEQLLARLVLHGDAMDARVGRLEGSVASLDGSVASLDARVGRLDGSVASLDGSVASLDARVGRLEGGLGEVRGRVFEIDYRDKFPAYFAPIARRVRRVAPHALADLLDGAVDAGQLTAADRDEVMRADLVLTGRPRDAADDQDAYFVVELSAGIGPDDVRRALSRSRTLAKLGQRAVPVVAGESITREAADAARSQQVLQLLDGRIASAEPD